jgi:YfiR/HmsC-like
MPLLQKTSLAVALTLMACLCAQGASDTVSSYRLKAAFLLNFCRFVEWPAGAFASDEEPLRICIAGKDPSGGELERVADGKIVNGRPVQIRTIAGWANIPSCHLVFVPASVIRRQSEWAATPATLGVLTVGEAVGFADRGGMINFVVTDGHVRFEINPIAAERGRLKVSSKLLQLAARVGD